MTIFHDAEFKAANLDVEIAYPVHTAKSFPLRDNRWLAPRQLEEITAARRELRQEADELRRILRG